MIVIVMGVAGSGKTTIGSRLARELGWPFFEADELHPPANVAKMRGGSPLTDADRQVWLEAAAGLIRRLAREDSDAVLACSALKRAHRRRLRRAGEDVRFAYLRIGRGTAIERLGERESHFFGPELAGSQFADLEEPVNAVTVDGEQKPGVVIDELRGALGL